MYDYYRDDYVNFYTIKSGDTLYKIANEFGVNAKLLSELNGLNMEDYIYPGDTIKIPKKGVKYYITKETDTLRGVSNIFNKTESEIIAQNKTIYLLPGQMIFYKES